MCSDAMLFLKPHNKIIFNAFGLSIKWNVDLHASPVAEWWIDNLAHELLEGHEKLNNYPPIYTFQTFFHPRLLSGGQATFERWKWKADMFSNTITVPFHLGDDLCKASTGICNKTVKY